MNAPPTPHRRFKVGAATVLALPDAEPVVRRAIADAGSLFEFARTHPEARPLQGRGIAFRIPAPGGDWVVRHYRRGGAVARLLGDRYLRWGSPRPFRELQASRGVRLRGVPTPEVQAAVVYPASALYRGDIATRFVPDSIDLADLLFLEPADHPRRLDACLAAERLLTLLARQGVYHPDLNLKNILLHESADGMQAMLLDLDRSRLLDGPSASRAGAMRARLLRSVAKWEARTGRTLSPAERRALSASAEPGPEGEP